jgi:hypothetical protein
MLVRWATATGNTADPLTAIEVSPRPFLELDPDGGIGGGTAPPLAARPSPSTTTEQHRTNSPQAPQPDGLAPLPGRGAITPAGTPQPVTQHYPGPCDNDQSSNDKTGRITTPRPVFVACGARLLSAPLGGGGGIRTHGGVNLTRFRGVLLWPLGHATVGQGTGALSAAHGSRHDPSGSAGAARVGYFLLMLKDTTASWPRTCRPRRSRRPTAGSGSASGSAPA